MDPHKIGEATLHDLPQAWGKSGPAQHHLFDPVPVTGTEILSFTQSQKKDFLDSYRRRLDRKYEGLYEKNRTRRCKGVNSKRRSNYYSLL